MRIPLWCLGLALIAVPVALLIGPPSTAHANIPEYDWTPTSCDGPCMGSNDGCCNPSYDPGGGGWVGGVDPDEPCAGLYCQYIPEGPDGQPSRHHCQTGASQWDGPHNECTDPAAGGYCVLSDPCSSN